MSAHFGSSLYVRQTCLRRVTSKKRPVFESDGIKWAEWNNLLTFVQPQRNEVVTTESKLKIKFLMCFFYPSLSFSPFFMQCKATATAAAKCWRHSLAGCRWCDKQSINGLPQFIWRCLVTQGDKSDSRLSGCVSKSVTHQGKERATLHPPCCHTVIHYVFTLCLAKSFFCLFFKFIYLKGQSLIFF